MSLAGVESGRALVLALALPIWRWSPQGAAKGVASGSSVTLSFMGPKVDENPSGLAA